MTTFNEVQDQMLGILHPEKPHDWQQIVEDCALSVNAICEDFEFKRQTFIKWIWGDQVPRKQNRERLIDAMRKLTETKKLPWHPSYGYATPEQIEKLNIMGLGPDRDRVLKQIELQNKQQGKIR